MSKEEIRKRYPMASATGMPASFPVPEEGGSLSSASSSETTPLLGLPGPIKQSESQALPLNFVSGWGFLAVLSSLSLLLLTLYTTLNTPGPFILFLYHPILQSLSLLFATLSILVLQPTHTASQKQQGQKSHGFLMLLSMLFLTGGVCVIEYNKIRSGGAHLHSPHGVLGILAAAWFLVQYLGGFTMLNVPSLYGGENKARAVWKYHRRAGYLLYFGMLAAVVASGATDYVATNLFGVAPPMVLGLILVVGVYSRVRKEKLGF